MKGGGAEGGAAYNYSAGWWLQMEKKIPFLFVKRAHQAQGKQRITSLSWRFILKATSEKKKSEQKDLERRIMLMIELLLTARLSCVEGAGYYFVQATRGKHAKKKKKRKSD